MKTMERFLPILIIFSLAISLPAPVFADNSSEDELIQELGPEYLRAGYRRARTHRIAFSSEHPDSPYVLRLINGNGREIRFQKCNQRRWWHRIRCHYKNRYKRVLQFFTKVKAVKVKANGRVVYKNRRFSKMHTFVDIDLNLQEENRFKFKVKGFPTSYVKAILYRVSNGNMLPLAEFSSSVNELSVDFDASNSSDPDGQIESFEWDFGDGNSGSGWMASHQYAQSGEYQVRLVVTDNQGGQAEMLQSVVVADTVAPVLAVQDPAEGSSYRVMDVPVSGSSNEPLSSASVNGQALSVAPDGMSFSGIFSAPQQGNMMVAIEAADMSGNVSVVERNISINTNSLPSGDFFYGHQNQSLPMIMEFAAIDVVDIDGQVVSFDWDFGNGATASGPTATQLFFAPGTFTVSLTLTDDQGGVTVISKDIIAANNMVPIADFSVLPPGMQAPATITFDGSLSSDPDGQVTDYMWRVLDDGREFSGQVVDITFADPGEYQVELTAMDALHGFSRMVKTVIVTESAPPVINLVVNNNDPTAPAVFEFDASGSFDPDGQIVSFEWSFGDGSTGSGDIVSHTYHFPGSYQVELTVTDDNGDRAIQSVIVQVQ